MVKGRSKWLVDRSHECCAFCAFYYIYCPPLSSSGFGKGKAEKKTSPSASFFASKIQPALIGCIASDYKQGTVYPFPFKLSDRFIELCLERIVLYCGGRSHISYNLMDIVSFFVALLLNRKLCHIEMHVEKQTTIWGVGVHYQEEPCRR
jgi:hypothetical protein